MKSISRYLKIFIGLIIGVYVFVGAVNLFVDPYGIYGSPTLQGINALKVDVDQQARILKAFQVRARKPHGLIAGSSRAQLGIPADHPAWPERARPVYNLSLYGGYLYETMRYFQHAAALGTVRDAVLAVDLWMFDRDWATRPGFDEARFLVAADGTPQAPDDLEPIRILFVWDTFRASLRILGRQDRDDVLVQSADGTAYWRTLKAWLDSKYSHHQQFGYMEHMFATTAWQPEQARRWDVTDPTDSTSPLQYFRTMVQTAYAQEINLKIVISPSHARIWEVLFAAGMWQTWEDWKRALLTIIEEEAARAGAAPFPLWDFSGYNTITTEDLPRNPGLPMQWYLDGSHFNLQVGGMMLTRIFDANGAPVPPDFGRRLTLETMDAALADIRRARAEYAVQFPDDVSEAADWGKQ